MMIKKHGDRRISTINQTRPMNRTEDVTMVSYSYLEGMEKDFYKTISTSENKDLPGSKDLNYLVATPSIIDIVIDGASQMLDSMIPEDLISVGTHIEISHEHPTLIGEKINLRIKVDKVINNKVFLEFLGTDSKGVFCRGKYERHIVSREKLKEAAYDRLLGKPQH